MRFTLSFIPHQFDASGGHYTVICNFLETVDLLMRRQYESIECFSMWAHETYDIGRAPCIPLMQLNMLRHRLMQHFTRVGKNGE